MLPFPVGFLMASPFPLPVGLVPMLGFDGVGSGWGGWLVSALCRGGGGVRWS